MNETMKEIGVWYFDWGWWLFPIVVTYVMVALDLFDTVKGLVTTVSIILLVGLLMLYFKHGL